METAMVSIEMEFGLQAFHERAACGKASNWRRNDASGAILYPDIYRYVDTHKRDIIYSFYARMCLCSGNLLLSSFIATQKTGLLLRNLN